MRDGEVQVGADPIPGTQHNKITAHQLGRVDDPQLTVPAHPGVYRKQRAESLC